MAQWQTEWSRWLVTGSSQPLSDVVSAHVVVLSEMLPQPMIPVSRAKTG